MLNDERVTILIEFLCGGVDKSGSRSEIKEVLNFRTESTKLVFSSIWISCMLCLGGRILMGSRRSILV